MKVLLAEDNPETLELLLILLRDCGRVDAATTGREATQLYRMARERGDPYDLLLFDVAMPLSLGTTALREIRAEGGDTPAILLTALEGRQVEERAAGLTNFKVIWKPFEPRALLEEVGRVGEGVRRSGRV